jgi:dipeptidyl aminopeptidase/acylaminoacyl peptidase
LSITPLNPLSLAIRQLIALVAAWAAAAVAHGQDAAKITLPAAPPEAEALFREPVTKSVAISPTGTHVAIIVDEGPLSDRLVVIEIASMKTTLSLIAEDTDLDYVDWVNNRRLIYIASTPANSESRVGRYGAFAAVDFDGSNRRLNFARARLMAILTGEGPRSTEVYGVSDFSRGDVDTDYADLFAVDTMTGHRREIETPPRSTRWVLDRQGEVIAATRRDGVDTIVMLRSTDGRWRDVHRNGFMDADAIHPLYVSPIGELVVASNVGRDHLALFTLDRATGKLSDTPLLDVEGFDIAARFIQSHGELVGLRYSAERSTTLWLKPELRKLQARIDAALPGRTNRIFLPRHPETDFALLSSGSSTQPSQYFLVDTRTGKLITRLGNTLPGVNPAALSERRFVRFTARDGRSIPAWVTMPGSSASGRNLPLVVLVHGGPWERGGYDAWDSEVQFLASRGYVVIEPEYRGSTGFGHAHFAAGAKQWGLAMQADLEDAARWAVAQGVADASRICIAGAGYGGYAALMGVAVQGETFRCAVSWLAPTDLELMFVRGVPGTSEVARRLSLPRLIGDPQVDVEQLRRTSPVNLARQIKRPVLLAYGRYDRRVPIEHGERMRDAMQRAGNPPQWIEYLDEGHGWAKTANRVDFWSKVEAFLDANLRGAR